VKFHADDFADAVFFHRHAVEYVGHADGAFVVRDDDELRMRNESLQKADEATTDQALASIETPVKDHAVEQAEDAPHTREEMIELSMAK